MKITNDEYIKMLDDEISKKVNTWSLTVAKLFTFIADKSKEEHKQEIIIDLKAYARLCGEKYEGANRQNFRRKMKETVSLLAHDDIVIKPGGGQANISIIVYASLPDGADHYYIRISEQLHNYFEEIEERFYLRLNKPYTTEPHCWLNLRDDGRIFLFNETEIRECKTRFTRKEIDKLADDFGKCILEDFEVVKVEE